jgi:hypothetical protein
LNRFTRFLQQWIRPDDTMAPLIDHLDALEALVIRVYKGNGATAADEAEYDKLRVWLTSNYPSWQAAMQPHWQESLVGGEPAQEDPVLRLLQAEKAGDFAGDWGAMQHLPAVREALNRLIMANHAEE